VGFAAAAEGASTTVKTQAAAATAKLNETSATVDRAIAAAQSIRAAASPAEAAARAQDLVTLVTDIGTGLDAAQADMRVMMKAEGL
jgi:hypothetical protein